MKVPIAMGATATDTRAMSYHFPRNPLVRKDNGPHEHSIQPATLKAHMLVGLVKGGVKEHIEAQIRNQPLKGRWERGYCLIPRGVRLVGETRCAIEQVRGIALMTRSQEEMVDQLKRVAQEKGYAVDTSQGIISLVPCDSRKASASFPIDEIEMAIEWLELWVQSDR